MEISGHDIRKAAEEAQFCQLVHWGTREPLEDDNGPVGFMVLGRAGHKAQQNLKSVEKAVAARSKGAVEDDAHEISIMEAMALITEARNLTVGGEDVGSDKDLIRAVLQSTFPEFRTKTVEEDGEEAGLSLVNLPFARQVINFSARQEHYLGK